jgi:hypothetical protein
VAVCVFLLWWVALRHLASERAGALELICVVLGAVLIIWHVLEFTAALRRKVRNFVVLKSETGSVRVHASAVEEALRHTAKSLPEVHDVHVRLVIDKQTRVPRAGEVDARIKDITNIVSVHDALSKVLRERYQQIIPGAPDIDFHLTIKHHFRPPSKPKKKKKDKDIVPPEEDETKAIRAPQYPVPDED